MALHPVLLEKLNSALEPSATIALTQREWRALDEAGNEYPAATRTLLTQERSVNTSALPAGIDIQPVYAWLLAPARND